MHTMKRIKDGKKVYWSVGFFEPTDDGGESWYPLREFNKERPAAAYVNYLNGGNGIEYPLEET